MKLNVYEKFIESSKKRLVGGIMAGVALISLPTIASGCKNNNSDYNQSSMGSMQENDRKNYNEKIINIKNALKRSEEDTRVSYIERDGYFLIESDIYLTDISYDKNGNPSIQKLRLLKTELYRLYNEEAISEGIYDLLNERISNKQNKR